MSIRSQTLALGLAGALTLGATVSASAGPFPVGTGIKDAAAGKLTEIRWRGRGVGPGLAFGLAAGALVGAAVAARPYYEPDYYYPGPIYADPYVYAPGPVYVAPGYSGYYGYPYGGPCYTNEGYGRRSPCDSR